MKTKIVGLLLVAVMAMPACNEYFDYENSTLLDEDFVFSDYTYMKQVLANAYTQLPSSFNYIDNGMLASTTDEAEHSWDYSTVQRFNGLIPGAGIRTLTPMIPGANNISLSAVRMYF